jgi:hypothetical protein
MKRFIAAAFAVGSLVSSAPTFAADAGAFDKWLSPDAPECVPVSEIKSVATLTDLTPEQFQFVRALYVATPPISRKLPPGDHAIRASSGGTVMVALVAGGQTCARFLAPDFIQGMLAQVGEGMTVGLGEPICLPRRDSPSERRSVDQRLVRFPQPP